MSTIDHPPHYGGRDNPYEVIKVIEAWGVNYRLGNVLKYVGRAFKKGDPIENLEKAVWYLLREIETLKADRKNIPKPQDVAIPKFPLVPRDHK